MPSEPTQVNVTVEDIGPQPFVFQLTDKDGADIELIIGDEFAPQESFSDDQNPIMAQVGLRLVMLGLNFQGFTPEQTKLFGALVLQSKT